jgi:phosphatidate cytidylyltransferase
VLRARLVTAAIAIPALLALIFLAPAWGWAVTVGAVTIVGLVEYAGLAFSDRAGVRAVGVLLGLPVVVGALSRPSPGPLLAATLCLLVAGGLSYVVVARRDLDQGLTDVGLIILGVLYTALFLPHFYWLRELPDGPQWVTFVIAVAMAGDSGGYFIGHAIGRHKLILHVSPGKTLEGSLGIVLCSLLAGVVSKLILLPDHGWSEMLTLTLVMSLIGQFGDLGKSVVKRTFGVKDSGRIFPGHGGVLDRIDSLLFPVALVYYYLLQSAAPAVEG